MTKNTTLPKPLRGIVPPMLTPLTDRDTLDVAGLERLVERILAGEPAGLFILGTTGEGPSLGYRLRQELIARVAEQVAGRVPVLVGVTDTSFADSLGLAEFAADEGAAAVVLAPPPYFPVAQRDLLEYVERMAEVLPLPLLLYNMPSHTKLVYEPETVCRAIEIPNVVGLKDSSGDMTYFARLRELAARRPDFSLLIGPEELLAEAVRLGAHGGVSGGANLCPRLYVDLYQAAAAGNPARTAELHARVMRISEGIYTCDRGSSGVIKGLKSALHWLGVCSDRVAEPLQPLAAHQRETIRKRLIELELTPYSSSNVT